VVKTNRARPAAPAWLSGANTRIAVAVAAGLVAGLAPGEPTGLLAWDFVLKATVAALAVTAVSSGPRWLAISFTTVATVFAGTSALLIVAAMAQLVAIAAAMRQRLDRLPAAIAAGLATQVFLRLPSQYFFGFPSLVAGVAIAAAFVIGYRYGSPPARRIVRRAMLGVSIGASAAALVGGVALISARADIDRGVDAARAALSSARTGDPEVFVTRLETAEVAFRRASDSVDSLAARPLRLLPVVAQHHYAVSESVAVGADVTALASATARSADIRTIQMVAGEVDLAALRQMAPQLEATAESLRAGTVRMQAVDSPWLLPPVADRLGLLTTEIQDATPDAALAAKAATVLPAMLGADAPRNYFVIFGTPAESREFGGLFGSWALLQFDNGSMRQLDAGKVKTLAPLAQSRTLDPAQYPRWYLESAKVDTFLQNVTGTPDVSVVAQAINDLIGGPEFHRIDGMVYADTWAVIDLLQLSGPLDVSFRDEPITFENGRDFFFDEQYRLDDPRNETFDSLAEALGQLVATQASTTLPGPEELGRLLGPAARGGRLQVATFDDAENDFLEDIFLYRRFEPSDVDGFAVIQTNAASNKLDLYLSRLIDYEVTVAADGSLTGSATINLSLDIPDNAPPGVLAVSGERVSTILLSFYTPHNVHAVTLDGVAVTPAVSPEYGLGRHLVPIEIPTGQTRSLVFNFDGFVPADAGYSVEVWHQPLVNQDQVRLTYQGVDRSQVEEIELRENFVFTPDLGE